MKILIGGIRVCGKLPPLLSPMVTWSPSLCAPGSSFSPFFLGLHSPVSYIQYLFLALLLYAFSSRNSHFPLIAASATMFFLSVNSFFETVFPHSTACEIHEHYSISKIQPTFSPPSLTFTYIRESHYPSPSYQPQHFEIILTSHFQTWKKNLVL